MIGHRYGELRQRLLRSWHRLDGSVGIVALNCQRLDLASQRGDITVDSERGTEALNDPCVHAAAVGLSLLGNQFSHAGRDLPRLGRRREIQR